MYANVSGVNRCMKNPFVDIYRSFEYENARKLPLREFPLIVDVEPTNHCNLRCKMCPQVIMKRERGFMSFDTYKKIIDECRKYGAAVRLIRYGEHLLHKQIFDFIGYAKEKGVLIHMTTNGLLLDGEKAKRLVELELDSIIFSFQGATKEGYEDMRNNNQYDLLVNHIKQLVEIRNREGKEKPWIHVSSTMTDESEEEIKQFKAFWGSIVDSVGVGKTTFSQVDKEQFHDIIKDYLPRETLARKYRPCSEVYQKLSVDWNGDITACCSDYDGLLVIGNVERNSLKEAWNCERLGKIRSMLEQMRMRELPLCEECYPTYEDF